VDFIDFSFLRHDVTLQRGRRALVSWLKLPIELFMVMKLDSHQGARRVRLAGELEATSVGNAAKRYLSILD